MNNKREALDLALEYLRASGSKISSGDPVDFINNMVKPFEEYLNLTPSYGFKPNRVFYIKVSGMTQEEQEKFLEDFAEKVKETSDYEKYVNWVFGTLGETRIEITG